MPDRLVLYTKKDSAELGSLTRALLIPDRPLLRFEYGFAVDFVYITVVARFETVENSVFVFGRRSLHNAFEVPDKVL